MLRLKFQTAVMVGRGQTTNCQGLRWASCVAGIDTFGIIISRYRGADLFPPREGASSSDEDIDVGIAIYIAEYG